MNASLALRLAGAFAVLVLGSWVSLRGASRAYPWPYPPIGEVWSKRTGLQDAALVSAGSRALAADAAWVQLLHYMASAFLPGEDRQKGYAELLPFGQRVIRLDPYFHRAALFAAGILGFFRTVNRPDEALALLREAASRDPSYWPYRQYAAAIGYARDDQFESMRRLLEEAITHPDCPAVVKAALASAYERQKMPQESARVWRLILNDPSAPEYHERARRKLAALGR